MLKACDVMNRNVVTISPDQSLLEAMKLLVCKEISGLPVVNSEDQLIGIVTEKDILNFVFSGNLKNTKVKEVMTCDVKSFPPDEKAEYVALVIGENKFRRVPIVEADKVVGIVSRRDILRVVLDIHCKK
ncbi:CBS domain-containing protein [bacterium]|nr:CBS domain-containing protein [bacterium]